MTRSRGQRSHGLLELCQEGVVLHRRPDRHAQAAPAVLLCRPVPDYNAAVCLAKGTRPRARVESALLLLERNLSDVEAG